MRIASQGVNLASRFDLTAETLQKLRSENSGLPQNGYRKTASKRFSANGVHIRVKDNRRPCPGKPPNTLPQPHSGRRRDCRDRAFKTQKAAGGVTESGRRLECFSNLRQIHVALQMYADDHSGWLPPDLKTLRLGYLDNDPVYHCPAREGKSEVADYEYFGRGHKISDPPFLLMAEHDGNHQFHYRNMMLSNGERCSRHVPLKKPGK